MGEPPTVVQWLESRVNRIRLRDRIRLIQVFASKYTHYEKIQPWHLIRGGESEDSGGSRLQAPGSRLQHSKAQIRGRMLDSSRLCNHWHHTGELQLLSTVFVVTMLTLLYLFIDTCSRFVVFFGEVVVRIPY